MVSAEQKAWRGTEANDWFGQAEQLLAAQRAVQNLEAMAQAQPKRIDERTTQKSIGKLLTELAALKERLTAADLQAVVEQLRQRTTAHVQD